MKKRDELKIAREMEADCTFSAGTFKKQAVRVMVDSDPLEDSSLRKEFDVSIISKMKQHKHTPADPRIFVFGSNLAGIHGAGAAKYAMLELSARPREGIGMTGHCYALPTCRMPGEPLPLDIIEKFINDFIEFALSNPSIRFFVSAVGCGIAGFSEEQIAPYFANAPNNCDLPPNWREWQKNEKS